MIKYNVYISMIIMYQRTLYVLKKLVFVHIKMSLTMRLLLAVRSAINLLVSVYCISTLYFNDLFLYYKFVSYI